MEEINITISLGQLLIFTVIVSLAAFIFGLAIAAKRLNDFDDDNE